VTTISKEWTETERLQVINLLSARFRDSVRQAGRCDGFSAFSFAETVNEIATASASLLEASAKQLLAGLDVKRAEDKT
jgi:hypothetical protein